MNRYHTLIGKSAAKRDEIVMKLHEECVKSDSDGVFFVDDNCWKGIPAKVQVDKLQNSTFLKLANEILDFLTEIPCAVFGRYELARELARDGVSDFTTEATALEAHLTATNRPRKRVRKAKVVLTPAQAERHAKMQKMVDYKLPKEQFANWVPPEERAKAAAAAAAAAAPAAPSSSSSSGSSGEADPSPPHSPPSSSSSSGSDDEEMDE